MKNFLLLALSATAAYLVGRGRAQKARRTSQLVVEVKCDASQALAALNKLETRATDVHTRVIAQGKDLQEALRYATSRALRTH